MGRDGSSRSSDSSDLSQVRFSFCGCFEAASLIMACAPVVAFGRRWSQFLIGGLIGDI